MAHWAARLSVWQKVMASSNSWLSTCLFYSLLGICRRLLGIVQELCWQTQLLLPHCLRQCKNPSSVLVLGCFLVGDANELHHSYCLFPFTHYGGTCLLPSLGKDSPDTQGFCENKKILQCLFYIFPLVWACSKRNKSLVRCSCFMETPLNITFFPPQGIFF